MKKITAFGEILYDIYPDKKRLGGAPFNFIYHVWKLLGHANFISAVGNDDLGNELIVYLKSISFNTNYISIDDLHPTGSVRVTLSSDKTPRFKISKECCYDFLEPSEELNSLIQNSTDLLYFGTLAQRSKTSRSTIENFMNFKTEFFCDMNLRHDFFNKEMIEKALNVCSVIKLNKDELNKLVSILDLNVEKPEIEILTKYNLSLLAITDGENGANLLSEEYSNFYKPNKINPVDTLGAGDAYSAILAIGYLYNWTLENINRVANNFASEICMVNGALPNNDAIYEKYKKLLFD